MQIRRTRTMAMGMTCLLAAGALPVTTFAQEKAVLDEVIVTGSRIARPNLTQPTPVTTISSDELRMSGTPDLGKSLADLPSLGSTGTLAGSSNSFSDTAGLNLPDLRRLGINRTLTLVDGKRHVGGSPGSTAVDLGSIPISLVERVEIITGGASAVYGSDAVSGVINIITRKDFEGVAVNAEMGEATSGGYGKNYQAGLTLGSNFADDRGNFTVSIIRDHIGDVQATDLSQSHEMGSVANPQNTGENDGIADRFLTRNVVSDQVDENGVLIPDHTLTSFSSDDGYIAFLPNGTPVPQQLRQYSNSGGFGSFPNGCSTCFGVEDYITVLPEIERTALQTTARYKLADPVTFYVDAKYVDSDIQEELQPSFNFGDLSINVADNPFLNEQLRAELLAGGETEVLLTRFHADAGSRRNNIERETKRIVSGFDGELDTAIGNISYDLFFNHGETTNVVQGQNRQIPRNFFAAVDAIRDASGEIVCRDESTAVSGGCVPFNPFGRTNSPEAVRYSFVQTTEEQTLTQQNAGLSLVSDTSKFLNLPAGPIGWAFGLEWREEKTSTDGDALVQADLTESSAQPDQDGGYKVSEAFVEVTVPLLADKFLVDTLSLDAAFRTADYSHAGTANAWKVGAIWAPISQLRFRGTISEAVRAPNIVEAFLPATPVFADVDDPCDVDSLNDDPERASNCAALGLPANFEAADNASVVGEDSGNPNLDPEESRSYTLGLVYQPTWAPGLSLTVDYYDIEITDAITSVDPQDIIENCVDAAGGPDSNFCSLFTRDPVSQDIDFVRSTFVNASKLETQGIDVELRYTQRLSDLTANSAMSWLSGTLTGSFTGTYLKKLNEFVFQDRPDEIDVERGEVGDPIHAYRASLTYQQETFAIGWNATYVGSVKRYAVGVDICEDISPCDVSRSIIHDINARFFVPTETMNLEVYAGVNNVFDNEPPYGLLGVEGDEAIYDALGRRYFVGVRSSF
jgi:outer membrane receptor protein involved in Fe transport